MAGKKLYLEIDDVERIVEQEDKDTYNPYLHRGLQLTTFTKYRLHASLNDVWLDWPSRHDLRLVTMDYCIVPTKVIFNFPATIVFWQDGTKTVVKCGDDDVWDPEKAIAMCIAKKVLGNTGYYNNRIRKMMEMGGVDPKIEKEESKEWSVESISEAIDRVADKIKRYTIPIMKEESNDWVERD